ncbi:MAG: hypothetical protein U0790_16545 [Isosphaeraceae bacterium]
MAEQSDRRRFLGATMLGTAGAGAFISLEEKSLQAALDQKGTAAPPSRPAYQGETLPCGRIGSLSISRLMMGGNLIGGYAHSRDLLYVSRLLREYNTESKIFETFELAEQAGVNMIQVSPGSVDFVVRYRKQRGGKLQMMVCVDVDQADVPKIKAQIRELIDKGAETLYTHGERTDRQIMAGNYEAVGRTVELIKAAGVPGGIGSHSLETPIASEKHGLNPDYYVKTFHPDNYWSATPADSREEWCWYNGSSPDHNKYHDNIFDLHPDKTAAFMAKVAKPWVAFKVMAAGSIPAQIGINHAFQNGADFVIAGMFDFQLAADVEITVKALKRTKLRTRPWCA